MQVDDELDDLHGSQILLPLEEEKMQVSTTICTRMGIVTQTTDPYLGSTCSRIIVVVCCMGLRQVGRGDYGVHLHIRT